MIVSSSYMVDQSNDSHYDNDKLVLEIIRRKISDNFFLANPIVLSIKRDKSYLLLNVFLLL